MLDQKSLAIKGLSTSATLLLKAYSKWYADAILMSSIDSRK